MTLPSVPDSNLVKAAQLVHHAKRVQAEYKSDPTAMPADLVEMQDRLIGQAKKLIGASKSAATLDELDAFLREPEYKHDMTMGDTRPRTGDGRYATSGVSSNPRVLPPEYKMVDFLRYQKGADVMDAEYRLGYLGAHFKAQTGNPADLVEYQRRLPAEFKDMLTAGSSELIPEPVAAELIDRMRAAAVIYDLGARTVPMGSSTLVVPRVVADPTASWLAEGATITPTDGDVDGVTFTARRLTALTKVSDELAEDSDPVAIGDVLSQSMARSFATELVRVALRGTGTAPEPRGIRNQTGVSLTGSVGAADWADIAGLVATVQGNNAAPNGIIWAPRTANAVSLLRADGATGAYLAPPSHIGDIPRRATTAVPVDLGVGSDSEIYVGDWAQLMIGQRIEFELRVLDERYAEEGKIGIRGRTRADVQLAHGQAFAVGHGVTN